MCIVLGAAVRGGRMGLPVAPDIGLVDGGVGAEGTAKFPVVLDVGGRGDALDFEELGGGPKPN